MKNKCKCCVYFRPECMCICHMTEEPEETAELELASLLTCTGIAVKNEPLEMAFWNAFRRQKEELISKIDNWKPLKETHENCVIKDSCIGYQQAFSDFENEKEIFIKMLKDSNNSL